MSSDQDRILAQYPDFVLPIVGQHRLIGEPVVYEDGGEIVVRAWQYGYADDALIETENRLEGEHTAIVVVHPWDMERHWGQAGHLFGTDGKNQVYEEHLQRILAPLVARMRGEVGLIVIALSEREEINPALVVEAGDVVYRDEWGYAGLRDLLAEAGIRHILLVGYATDACLASTTAGYENLMGDFNVFVVGDGTMALFPAQTWPAAATMVELTQIATFLPVTEVGWIWIDPP